MPRRARLNLLIHLAGIAGAMEISVLLYSPRPTQPADDPLYWSLYLLPILAMVLLAGWRSGFFMVVFSLFMLSPVVIPVFQRHGLSVYTIPYVAVVLLFLALPLLLDRLMRQYRQQARLHDSLTRMTRLLEERLDLSSLLTAVLGEAAARCQAQYGVVYLLDPSTGEFDLAQTYGFKATSAVDQAKTSVGDPAMREWASQAAEPFSARDERGFPDLLLKIAGRGGEKWLKSILSAPLNGGAGCFGVIVLLNVRLGESAELDLEFLDSLARMSQGAIEQAWQYSQVKRAAFERGVLNELADSITASLDLNTAPGTAVASLHRAFPDHRVELYYCDPDDGRLLLRASADASGTTYPIEEEVPDHHYAAKVVQTGRPLDSHDLEAMGCASSLRPDHGERFGRFLGIPLLARDEAVGALCFRSADPASLDRREMDLLRAASEKINLALNNASAFTRTDRDLSRRVMELSCLEDLAKHLNATKDADVILDLVLAQCIRLTAANAGVAATARRDARGIDVRHSIPGEMERSALSERAAVRLGKAIGSGDIYVGPLATNQDGGDDAGLRISQMCVPVLRSSRCIGAIYLESYRRDAFSRADVKFITHLAEHAAVALENAELFDRIEDDRKRISHVLEAMADGVFTTDRDRRITSFNRAAERITGWSQKDVMGRPACDLMHPSHNGASGEDCPLAVSMEQGKVVQGGPVRWRPRWPGSEDLQVAFSTAPLDSTRGEAGGTVTVFRDVTAQAAVDRLKSEFVSMVSHEFRSPLTAIRAATEMMTLETGRRRSAELLEVIHAETQRLSNFVDDVISVSRLEMGSLELKVEPFPVVPVVKQAVAVAEATTSRHTFKLLVDHDNILVLADSDKVRMVLANLLRNAVNYSPSGGNVTVSVREDAGQAWISVRDEGIGIPRDQLDYVFERFSRLDNSDAKAVYGHGLGLHISQGLVERHGGRIWAESEVGRGSTFHFTLPLLTPEIGAREGD